jgi:hypothetical protein
MRCTLMNTYEHLSQYLAKFFLEWDMLQINLLGNIKVCFLFNFFSENLGVYEMCKIW